MEVSSWWGVLAGSCHTSGRGVSYCGLAVRDGGEGRAVAGEGGEDEGVVVAVWYRAAVFGAHAGAAEVLDAEFEGAGWGGAGGEDGDGGAGGVADRGGCCRDGGGCDCGR